MLPRCHARFSTDSEDLPLPQKQDGELTHIWDKLDKDNFADPNENYHILETEIINQRLKHWPTKIVKYKKHKHKKAGWITYGIIRD